MPNVERWEGREKDMTWGWARLMRRGRRGWSRKEHKRQRNLIVIRIRVIAYSYISATVLKTNVVLEKIRFALKN